MSKRKTISVLLTFVMVFALTPSVFAGGVPPETPTVPNSRDSVIPAAAGEEFEADGIKYKVLTEGAANTVAAIGYIGEPTTLPATVSRSAVKYEVVRVGGFRNCKSLTVVDLSNVTNLEGGAFRDCNNLTLKPGTNLHPSLAAIPDTAFRGCPSLGAIDLTNVTSIGHEAFYGCAKLTLEPGTNVSPNLTDIGGVAFSNCSSLAGIDLSNVKTLGFAAFEKCSSLTTVDFSRMTEIGPGAFKGCSALKAAVLPSSKPVIAADSFAGVPALMLIKSGDLYADMSGLPANSAYPTLSGGSTLTSGDALTLAVTPNVGNAVSYQWYKNLTELSGETARTYSASNMSPSDEGSYWCKVTVGTVSKWAQRDVTVNLQSPKITKQPKDATYTAMDTPEALEVEASVTDGGKLTYQWYRYFSIEPPRPESPNVVPAGIGLEPIEHATARTYKPDTTKVGSEYYRCVVTNLNKGEASTMSESASVIVNLQTPKIATHPQGATYTTMDMATALTVDASVTDGGTLTYQWYQNTDHGTTGGTKIPSATSSTYTPDITTVGTVHYYCVITNTNGNQSVDIASECVDVTAMIPSAARAQLTYSLAAKTYDGKAHAITVTPKSGAGKVTTVYYNGSKALPKNAGTYAITVDMAAGATYDAAKGLLLGTFTINKADVSKAKISIADTAWTGKKAKPTKFTYNGLTFGMSSNATVVSYGKNVNIGKGTIKITGKGNFTGTKTITFKITPKKNAISKIAVGKKQMNLTWKKAPASQKIARYQIRYKVKGTSSWKVKTFKASDRSAAIKGLKKGKKYEISIRSYKVVSGAKYYSTWSAPKTSKTIK